MLARLRRAAAVAPPLRPKSRFSSAPKKMKGSCRTPGAGSPAAARPSPRGSRSVPVGKSSMYQEDDPSLSSNHVSSQRSKSPHALRPQRRRPSSERLMDGTSLGRSESVCKARPFDICKSENVGPVKLKASLLEVNREKRKEIERSKAEPQHVHLNSGMVLMKNFISHHDQVRIIQTCRELGIGVGGFYRPGYRDGAKLHLQMMCLGKNWDPESRLYEDKRPFDGAEPPKIPKEFKVLVDRAIQTSQEFLRKNLDVIKIEDELPTMSPDICIVNFYSDTGKLGLHQDRDESKESLRKGLPVVSFSLGDSAEFLYGSERDVDKAGKVILESGDVLIFGGKSRHIFHGVSTILPNTAPKRLSEETRLLPGRLNLTFRQYN